MSDPSSVDFAAEWEAELDGRTTVEKIYDVALQLAEPLRVADIADRAGVAPDTARKYLGFLTEIGIVKKASDDPATYRRNDDYLEWRRVDRLRTEHTVEELETRISELSEQIQVYQETYEAATPKAVAPQDAGYETLDETLADLRQWEAARSEVDQILTALGRDKHIADTQRVSTGRDTRGPRTVPIGLPGCRPVRSTDRTE
ncbi:hypothetical protein SAMN04487950_3874 [Halogranum rubrum]|uniref:Sugar-specific transcriptional regulator TrmB n=1 Tax=Halogranum rubrum TaxID=553466 RepID=A0A1I4HX36_9EURY|nr:hypothetical protein [Halogranum rubrum]SFL46337.1 hypothetical protein SAMN04487950_3874 [Halogranum rubrum]